MFSAGGSQQAELAGTNCLVSWKVSAAAAAALTFSALQLSLNEFCALMEPFLLEFFTCWHCVWHFHVLRFHHKMPLFTVTADQKQRSDALIMAQKHSPLQVTKIMPSDT